MFSLSLFNLLSGCIIGYLLWVGFDHACFKMDRYKGDSNTPWFLLCLILFVLILCPVFPIQFLGMTPIILVIGGYGTIFFSRKKMIFLPNHLIHYNIKDIVLNKSSRLVKIIEKLRSNEMYNKWFCDLGADIGRALDIEGIYADISPYFYEDNAKDQYTLNFLGTRDYKLFVRFVVTANKKRINYIVLDRVV